MRRLPRESFAEEGDQWLILIDPEVVLVVRRIVGGQLDTRIPSHNSWNVHDDDMVRIWCRRG